MLACCGNSIGAAPSGGGINPSSKADVDLKIQQIIEFFNEIQIYWETAYSKTNILTESTIEVSQSLRNAKIKVTIGEDVVEFNLFGVNLSNLSSSDDLIKLINDFITNQRGDLKAEITKKSRSSDTMRIYAKVENGKIYLKGKYAIDAVNGGYKIDTTSPEVDKPTRIDRERIEKRQLDAIEKARSDNAVKDEKARIAQEKEARAVEKEREWKYGS